MATVTQIEPASTTGPFELQNLNPSPKAAEPVADPEEPPPDNGPNRDQMLKLIAAGFSFWVSGFSDGSMGPLVPYIIREYNVTTAVVSVVYGASFLGWLVAAMTNTHLLQRFKLGGLLAVGAGLQIVAQALRPWKPPFPLYAVTFWLVYLGQAYQDAGCNTYTAGVKGAHRWLAFIHAMYTAGCLVGPFAATPIAASHQPSRWFLFYFAPLCICVVNFSLTCYAFRDTIHLRFSMNTANETTSETGSTQAASENGPGVTGVVETPLTLIKQTFASKAFWAISLFFFFYLGAVITASSWVVEFLVQVREGNIAQMGYVPAGFNGGAFLGRVLLAEPIHRFGEKRMIPVFVILCIAFQLVFWLVPNVIAASVAISLVGFFSGPFFAAGMFMTSRLFSPDVKTIALSFVFVFGQAGGSLFPIITGVVASSVGVRVLQPILVTLWVGCGISSLLIPNPKTLGISGLHQE